MTTVAWVAAEHPEAWELALKWIDSKNEQVAATGWKKTLKCANATVYTKVPSSDKAALQKHHQKNIADHSRLNISSGASSCIPSFSRSSPLAFTWSAMPHQGSIQTKSASFALQMPI